MAAIVAGCALGLASPVTGTLPPGQDQTVDGLDSCHSHLNALVVFLEETAQIEGAEVSVEWQDDGTVVLHYEEFSQHMWCQDGELHIDIDCGDTGFGQLQD